MKGPLLLTAVLALTPVISSAQGVCQNIFTSIKANEIASLGVVREFDLRATPEYADAHRRFPELRPLLDYRDATSTLVLHTGSLSLDGYRYYTTLLKNLPQDVRTVLIGPPSSYETSVQYSYARFARQDANKKPLDTFLAVDNEAPTVGDRTVISKWIQDHMGRLVTYKSPIDGKDVVGLVTAGYRFGYEVSSGLSRFLGVSINHRIAADHEWGNYVVVGKTAYLIQGPRIDSNLNVNSFAHTGVDKVVLLPRPKDQKNNEIGIPHSDEFMIPLSDNLVLTNVREYASHFEAQGLQSKLLPNNADMGLDFFTYTNAVFVNSPSKKLVFVPQFGELQEGTTIFGMPITREMIATLKVRDLEALEIYRQHEHSHGLTIVPVHVPEFTASHFGGPHCATGICASIGNPSTRPAFVNEGSKGL